MTARTRTTLLATLTLAAAIALSSCASTPPAITEDTSDLLQSTIVAAATQAAAGHPTAALSTLDTLQTQLQHASDAGDITPDRATTIQHTLDLVRADLQPTPTIEPATPTTPDPTTPDPTTTDPTIPTVTETTTEDTTSDTGTNGKPDKPDKSGNGKNK